jgi:hypothetical protein
MVLVLKESSMKALKVIAGLFFLIILTSFGAYAQQQFTHTVTTQNRYCNSTCTVMDAPGLNSNLSAIILVTPIAASGTNLNPHLIGAYYVDYLKKWSIMNADGVAIAVGASFNVEYYASPNANQFVYVIPAQGVTPYINHAGLNGYPNAKIRFFPTQSPKGAYFNLNEAKVRYDSSAYKWLIANINNTPVRTETAFNIVVDFSGVNTTDLTKLPDQNPKSPTKTPIDTSPSGTVNPTDRTKLPDQNPKTPGKIVPTDAPCNCPAMPPNGIAVGDIRKWNGTVWEPYTAPPPPPPLAASMQTYFKNDYQASPTLGIHGNFVFSNHTQSITVTKKSRLILSGSFLIFSDACLVCVTATKMEIIIEVNNAFNKLFQYEIPPRSQNTFSISNYMFDIEPGTHTIQFKAASPWIDGNQPGTAAAIFTSIIVQPL